MPGAGPRHRRAIIRHLAVQVNPRRPSAIPSHLVDFRDRSEPCEDRTPSDRGCKPRVSDATHFKGPSPARTAHCQTGANGPGADAPEGRTQPPGLYAPTLDAVAPDRRVDGRRNVRLDGAHLTFAVPSATRCLPCGSVSSLPRCETIHG